MEARRAIQQNMYRENSWGDGKQRLEELTTFPFSFRRKRLRWSGESSLEQRKLELLVQAEFQCYLSQGYCLENKKW